MGCWVSIILNAGLISLLLVVFFFFFFLTIVVTNDASEVITGINSLGVTSLEYDR